VETRVAPATVSSWESLNSPKTPTPARLSDYARFFATRRSLEGGPHLIAEKDLKPDELERFRELEDQLVGLLSRSERRSTFAFDDGPVTIICPEAPEDSRGPSPTRTTPTTPSSSGTQTRTRWSSCGVTCVPRTPSSMFDTVCRKK
jgi:hypothetical protein